MVRESGNGNKLAFDKGQVNPLKKIGVAITIKISVAFNWFGTRMLTKTPMKETEITASCHKRKGNRLS
jgi:hypothetical protein